MPPHTPAARATKGTDTTVPAWQDTAGEQRLSFTMSPVKHWQQLASPAMPLHADFKAIMQEATFEGPHFALQRAVRCSTSGGCAAGLCFCKSEAKANDWGDQEATCAAHRCAGNGGDSSA